MVFTGAGYFLGLHAPGRRGFKNFLPAMHHATLSMAAGGRVLRNVLPATAQIGTTFSASWVEAFSAKEKDMAAARKADALLNRLYLEPTLGLGYPVADLPPLREVERYMQAGDEANMAFDFDFHGLQLYTREVVKHSFWTPYLHAKLVHPKARGQSHTVMNWEVYPLALRLMLHRWNSYGKMHKIFVTENGAAFQDLPLPNGQIEDNDRTAYLQKHIAQMLQAKAEGVPLDGYFVWTYTDNFEWAEGYKPRFGLVHIDFETQKRTVKASGHWFASLLRQQKAAAANTSSLFAIDNR
jgi:beta-glucosidase